MLKDRYWWVNDGFPPFEAGDDSYPVVGQVIHHYRLHKTVDGRPLKQCDLANMLGISERSLWAMEHVNEGLDSFKRRVELAGLLDIPPILLKLDASTLSASYGHPGQIVREYRKKKKKENGTTWTQADLAEVLNLSEKSVRSMENQDVGLDSVSRREALVKILAIPPTLLGLDACHLFEKKTSYQSPVVYLPKQSSLDQQKLRTYQLLVPSFWENHYASSTSDSVQEIEKAIRDLHAIAPYVSDHHEEQVKELLCQYHQLALNFARDQGDFETALDHADRAIILAEKIEHSEFLAAALYRRGLMHFDMGNLAAAAHDLAQALPSARSARPQLKGMVYMEAGRFHAHMARSNTDRLYASKLLDQTEKVVQQGSLEDDVGYVKLDRGRYHIGRAATLLALHSPDRAFEELDSADRLTRPEHLRRHAYINILRARAYYAKRQFDFATELAIDALKTCLAIHSESNIADIAQLHALLGQTSFGHSPLVVQLGMMLLWRSV